RIGRIVWKKAISDELLYAVALADIDSNGKDNEIISAGMKAGYLYDNQGNSLWKVTNLEGNFCSAEGMDADSNGFCNEVALLNSSKGLYLFDNAGNFIFSKDTAKLGGSPGLAIKPCDTQPDGYLSNEIAVLVKGHLSVWTGTGSKLWDAVVSLSATEIGIGDVDRNGMMDNIVCGDKAFDKNGNIIRTYSTIGASVASGDLNGDGFLDEVVLGNQSLSAFNSTGTLLWTRFSGSDLINEILVIDLDSDAKNDLVLEKDNILYGLKNLGTTTEILWQYPTGNITSISAGDIDLDGKDEIIASGNMLYSFEKNGSLSLSYPLSVAQSALADINSDSAKDILSTSGGLLVILQDVSCEIKFDGGNWQPMNWDDGLRIWKVEQSFVKPGTHSYQVQCSKGGYITSTGTSQFYLSQIANVILRKKASSKAILEQGTITYSIEYEN
ncbi:MAG: VCBS repeat-containing protein, partial [Candidatus Desantisbacteria bacterium]